MKIGFPLKHRSFRTLLITHVLMFVLPMLVLIPVASRTITLAGEKQDVSLQTSLDQFALGIDAQLYDLMRFSQTLADSKPTSYLTLRSSISDRMDYFSYSNIRATMDDISQVRSTNNSVKNVYIYFSSSSRVLQYDGIYTDSFYFRQHLSGIFTSELEWMNFLHSAGTGAFLKDAANNIFYISCVGAKHPTYVVMQLEQSLLDDMAVALSNQGHVGIFNAGGEPLFSTGSGEITKRNIFGESDEHITIDGRTYIAYTKESPDKTGCFYVMLVPFESGNEPIRMLILWTISIAAATLAAELALAVMLSRKNYSPIRQLRDVISPFENKSNRDDIDAIRTYMTNLYDERVNLEHQSYELGKALRDSLLKHLLSDDNSSLAGVDTALGDLGVTPESQWFSVVTARLAGELPDDDVALIRFAVMNVFEEMLKPHFQVFGLDVDQSTVFVLCAREADVALCRGVLPPLLLDGCEFIGANFGAELLVCASDFYFGMGDIRKAWRRVLSMAARDDAEQLRLEWQHNQAQPTKLDFNMVESLLALRQKLINLILNGDGSEVRREFTALRKNKLPDWYTKIIVVEALLGSVNAIDLKRSSDEAAWESLEDGLDALMRMPPHQFWPSADDIVGQLCEYTMEKSPRVKTDNLDVRVNELLECEYANPALNVAQLAYRLGITASYLTAIYKQKTGQSILSALTQRRLAEIRRLLVETQKSIEEIATATGYYNSAALIRVFKRYEGITPGQYRTIYRDRV